MKKELFLEFYDLMFKKIVLPKEQIDMQNNYDFHLHRQILNASEMLGEFKNFCYNRNVQKWSYYGRLNFLPAPLPSFNMMYRLSNSRKRVFDCSQKI